MDRAITYGEAVREAADQEMERDPTVIVFGLDVDDPKAIQGTTRGLLQKYGAERVFGTPLSEDAMTGVAIGAALAGLRPVHVHIRMDFMMLAMNQLVNIAAKVRYMSAGQLNVPLVVRTIVGRSWGQGGQHSQALHSFFMHVPGLKVVAPTTPYDAKGCLIAAIRDNNPVVFMEHRLLHLLEGAVPTQLYATQPGRARVCTSGTDITIVGISHMQIECLSAERSLRSAGVSAEVIDPIWLRPLDIETIVESVRKTRRLLVVDNGWLTCGASAEIVAGVIERLPGQATVVRRMGFAESPCPPTPVLEREFYPDARRIAQTAFGMANGAESWMPPDSVDPRVVSFKGPF